LPSPQDSTTKNTKDTKGAAHPSCPLCSLWSIPWPTTDRAPQDSTAKTAMTAVWLSDGGGGVILGENRREAGVGAQGNDGSGGSRQLSFTMTQLAIATWRRLDGPGSEDASIHARP